MNCLKKYSRLLILQVPSDFGTTLEDLLKEGFLSVGNPDAKEMAPNALCLEAIKGSVRSVCFSTHSSQPQE
jgi:hypothetical protein